MLLVSLAFLLLVPFVSAAVENGKVLQATSEQFEFADADELSVSTTGELTIAFWVRFDKTKFTGEGSHKDYIHYLGKGDASTGYEYVFRQYNASNDEGRNNRLSFYIFNPEGGLGAGSYVQEPIKPGEWMFLTGVVRGKNVELWKNGMLKDIDPLSGYNIVPKNGAGALKRNDKFNGALDELSVYNRALSKEEIHQLYATGPFVLNGTNADAVNDTKLRKDLLNSTNQSEDALKAAEVLNFQFNNWASLNESRKRVADVSGNAHTGEVEGASFNAVSGVERGTYVYNGTDKIVVGDADDLSPAYKDAFTISFWTRFDEVEFVGDGSRQDYVDFLGKGSKDEGYEYVFRQYNASNDENKNNRISFSLFSKDGKESAGVYVQEPITPGEWMYLTVVYDGTSLQLWKDGTLKDEVMVNVTLSNGDAPLNLGGNGQKSFKGAFDNLQVFDRALSKEEVKELYRPR